MLVLTSLLAIGPSTLPELQHLVNTNAIMNSEIILSVVLMMLDAKEQESYDLVLKWLDLLNMLVLHLNINLVLFLLVPASLQPSPATGRPQLPVFLQNLHLILSDPQVPAEIRNRALSYFNGWCTAFRDVKSVSTLLRQVRIMLVDLGYLFPKNDAQSEDLILTSHFLNSTKSPEPIESDYCLISHVPFKSVAENHRFRCKNCGGLFLNTYAKHLPLIHLAALRPCKVCEPCFGLIRLMYERRTEAARSAAAENVFAPDPELFTHKTQPSILTGNLSSISEHDNVKLFDNGTIDAASPVPANDIKTELGQQPVQYPRIDAAEIVKHLSSLQLSIAEEQHIQDLSEWVEYCYVSLDLDATTQYNITDWQAINIRLKTAMDNVLQRQHLFMNFLNLIDNVRNEYEVLQAKQKSLIRH